MYIVRNKSTRPLGIPHIGLIEPGGAKEITDVQVNANVGNVTVQLWMGSGQIEFVRASDNVVITERVGPVGVPLSENPTEQEELEALGKKELIAMLETFGLTRTLSTKKENLIALIIEARAGV